MIGSHLIRAYSKTQSVVAKSSGESELYGIIRASTEGLGIVTLLKDFGVEDATVSIGIDATAAMGMAQRVGLNKVRHVEVDILWIQEQQARKLLPLRKIPGPRNPSDLCTKNVPASLVEQYMQQLSVRIVEGRAAVAQQLHILKNKKLVNASGEVGVLLAPVIGGQADDPAVFASSSDGVQLGEVTGGRLTEDRVKKGNKKKKSADERCVDSWQIAGEQGWWIRRHRTPRRTLFTPHRVTGGPQPDEALSTRRITKGTFIRNGKHFIIEDDYSVEVDAHKLLDGAWTGTTEFRKVEEIPSIVIEGEHDKEQRENVEDRMIERSSSSSGARIYAAAADSRPGPTVRFSWADCGSDPEEPAAAGSTRPTIPLSSLSARAAGGVSRCPHPRTESASPHHLGGEIGRMNGPVRQATIVSRSEAVGAASGAAESLSVVIPESQSPQMPRIISSRVASSRDLFRVSGPRARGSVRDDTGKWADLLNGSKCQGFVAGMTVAGGGESDRARRAASGLKALPRKVALPSLPARRSLRAAAVGRKSLGIVI